MKTIQVTGIGNLKIKPNQIQLNLTLQNKKLTYDETISVSEQELKEIQCAIEKAGLNKSNLKTKNFSVNPSYESYYDERKNYKKRFDGYKYSQSLTITFDLDNKLLGEVLYNLSKCKSVPEIDVGYTIKDKESAKNELLALAVSDSRNKAMILASSAHVELGDIINIDYSWSSIEVYSQTNYKMNCDYMRGTESGFELDVDPEDIHLSDNVKIIWEIK